MQSKKIKVLIIGDLHISDVFVGSHRNYFNNCINILTMYTKKIKEGNYTHVILTGDIVGVNTNDKNLRLRESLFYLMRLFKEWSDLTGGNLYSLRGNHDTGEKMTDFDYFTSLGIIKQTDCIESDTLKINLVDYGHEGDVVETVPDKTNVVVAHNNFQVSGITTWFRGGGVAYELASQHNWKGVDVIVAGHIHNPSPKIVQTTIDDQDCYLVYPGNATRPKKDNNWSQCIGLVLEDSSYEEDGKVIQQANMTTVVFDLPKFESLLTKDIKESNLVDDLDDNQIADFDIKRVSDVLSEMEHYSLTSGADIKEQVKRMGAADEAGSAVAIRIIDEVMMEMN